MRRCLVANRGEIALRVIRACHELGMEAVAVYSPVDATSAHVEQADAAYPLAGMAATESYLDGECLVAIALEAGCDCLHPGYGFLSESPAFARAVGAAGLCWVGPNAAAMQIMGVKTDALTALADTEVATLPRFAPEAEVDLAEYRAQAERIGYPLMVKAASGGGGRGIRIVRETDGLAEALAAAKREAARSFGDARLYLERYLGDARHIEVQIAADQQGSCLHLFERECSLQRRRQKIIEEAPASGITVEQRQALCQAAIFVARAVNYDNLGTVEFLLADDGAFYFLEMNTRLQVEHPVTELVCGIDLVRLQFQLARGEAMPFAQAEISARGHAIQCRIYAEAPRAQFRPATGIITQLHAPAGAGIRWDSALRPGDEITPHYDSLLAKLIIYDETRAAALARMSCALRDTVILGVETNLEFLQDLLTRPEVEAGGADTGFVERALPELLRAEEGQLPPEALLAAVLIERQPTAAREVAANADPWSRADRFRIGTSA